MGKCQVKGCDVSTTDPVCVKHFSSLTDELKLEFWKIGADLMWKNPPARRDELQRAHAEVTERCIGYLEALPAANG